MASEEEGKADNICLLNCPMQANCLFVFFSPMSPPPPLLRGGYLLSGTSILATFSAPPSPRRSSLEHSPMASEMPDQR